MPPLVKFTALHVNPVRIDIAKIEREVRDYVREYAESLVREVEQYPPVPAGSTYERTGVLGSSWETKVRRSGDRLEGSVVNNATDPRGRRYAVYVQGKWQTPQHDATGWLRVDQVAMQKRAEYRRALQAIYARGIRRAV